MRGVRAWLLLTLTILDRDRKAELPNDFYTYIVFAYRKKKKTWGFGK